MSAYVPLLVFALWLTQAAAAGVIADKKGHNFWAHFLLTLFVFGPLGIWIAYKGTTRSPRRIDR